MSALRQLLIVAVLGVISAAGYFGWTFHAGSAVTTDAKKGSRRPARGKRPAPVKVATVRAATFRKTVEAVGSTRALQSVDIMPATSGRVTAINLTSGGKVRKNAVLVTLDDEIQRADLAEAKAKLDEANLAYARTKKLYRRKNIAEARLIEARAKQAVARAELDRAKRRLADRSIRAPFAGRTSMRRIDVGARLENNTVVTTLDDISTIEIEAPIPEILFPKIKVGASVTATSAAFPNRNFVGTIATIDRRIDPVSRAFRVRVRIPNKDATLPTGMFMRVDLTLDERQGAAVPESALVVDADQKFVFAVQSGDKTVRRQLVTIGQRRGGLIEIIDGLKDGEKVITEGTHRLRDGKAIRIVPDNASKQSPQPTKPIPTAGLPGDNAKVVRKKDGG